MHHTPEQLLAMAAESARGERHITEHALCSFMSACIAPFGTELVGLWGETRAGRVSVATLRQSAHLRARVAEPATAPVGSLAMAYASTALLHARNALSVLRQQPTLTPAALYRLRVSIVRAYGCAATAAELTPRAWASGTRVEEALRRALVPCAAA